MSESAEKYIVLLLGVVKDRPIPSQLHLQKEMFVISRVVPLAQEIFTFKPHYYGPYSQTLDESVSNPMYFDNAFEIQNGSVALTISGSKLFNEITGEFQNNTKFSELLKVLKCTREIYDKFDKNELMFLIYKTWPDYTELSNMRDMILDREKQLKWASSLFSKGLVTKERFEELKRVEQ